MSIKGILFSEESVDAILATFEKQRAKLAALHQRLTTAAEDDAKEADRLLASSEAKREEAERAARVAQRITDLVG